MEAVLNSSYACEGIFFDPLFKEMKIDLSRQRKIRIVGVDETTGKVKEYFLKVTERKGLVLV